MEIQNKNQNKNDKKYYNNNYNNNFRNRNLKINITNLRDNYTDKEISTLKIFLIIYQNILNN